MIVECVTGILALRSSMIAAAAPSSVVNIAAKLLFCI